MIQHDPSPWTTKTESEPSQNLDSIAKFVAQLSHFIDRLPASADPERESKEMEFIVQPDLIYYYPELLKDWLLTRKLTSIRVTTVEEQATLAATTLEFTNDTDASILYVSRDSHPAAGADPAQHDVIVWPDRDPEQIPRMSDREIDAFLLTLCGQRWQAEMQAFSSGAEPIITDELTDALSKNAFLATTISNFDLPSGRALQLTTEMFAGKTTVKSFALYYETSSSRRLRATVDTSSGLEIVFHTIDPASSEAVGELIPDDGDYIRLAEILEEEIAMLQEQTRESPLAPTDIIELTE